MTDKHEISKLAPLSDAIAKLAEEKRAEAIAIHQERNPARARYYLSCLIQDAITIQQTVQRKDGDKYMAANVHNLQTTLNQIKKYMLLEEDI